MQVSRAHPTVASRTQRTIASVLVAVCCVGIGTLTSTDASAGSSVRVSGGVSFGSSVGSVGIGIHRGYRGVGVRGHHRHHGDGSHYAHPRWRIGLWVPLLPIGYATYSWGGAPYYVYDDAYFVTDGRGYRVVKKPSDEAAVSPVVSTVMEPGPAPVVGSPPKADGSPVPTFEQPARTGQLFAHPRNGQSETAATFDRIECESVGSKQTGFNPTLTPVDEAKKADYTRAVVACLEARGYSVK